MKLLRDRRYDATKTKNLLTALGSVGTISLKDDSPTEPITTVYFDGVNIGNIRMMEFVFSSNLRSIPQKVVDIVSGM